MSGRGSGGESCDASCGARLSPDLSEIGNGWRRTEAQVRQGQCSIHREFRRGDKRRKSNYEIAKWDPYVDILRTDVTR